MGQATSKSTINYLDGGEAKLAKIFGSADYNESDSWRNYESDWTINYHLSPLRKNLFDWIDWKKEAFDVLELGAGCGSLTSYFTRLPNVHKITAVEGSEARAELIKLRCKGSDKLEVVLSNIQDFATDRKYDLVLLIGVLEYSGKYVDGCTPFSNLLEHARGFLKKGGTLILAIENQLGHKYLAGYSEDHYGRPFEGISNYPNYDGARTFDRNSLVQMLDKAGLVTQRWFYPFPDYKMPNVILSDRSFSESNFDWLSLLELPTQDGCFQGRGFFNEREFLKRLSLNSSASSFMNSFLVFASESLDNIPVDDYLLAVKLNSLRSNIFKTGTYFKKDPNGTTLVVRRKGDEASNLQKEPYYAGYKNLGAELVDALYLHDDDRAVKLISLWLGLLKKRMIPGDQSSRFYSFLKEKIHGAIIYNEADLWLPHGDLEVTPTNILFEEDTNNVKVIDLEWSVPNIPMPLQLVIDRGMHDTITKLCRFTMNPVTVDGKKWNLSKELLDRLPDQIAFPDLRSHRIFDLWLQNMVLDPTSLLTKRQLSCVNRDVYWQRKLFPARYFLESLFFKVVKRIATITFFKKLVRAIICEL